MLAAPRCFWNPPSPLRHLGKATRLQAACESGGPSGCHRARQRTSNLNVTLPFMSAPLLTDRPRAEAASVEDLLVRITRGEVRIPTFQRPFAWTREDVKK